MAIRPVLHHPHEALRHKAEPVTEFDDTLRQEIADLIETCMAYRAHGLAAPQLGINKRMFVLTTEGEPQVFINPEITDFEGVQKMQEGCLSFPDVYETLERHEDIDVKCLVWEEDAEEPEERLYCFDGLGAVAFQHELDHLNGVLFIDKVSTLKRRYMIKALNKWKKTYMPGPKKAKKPQPSKRAKARRERKRKKKAAA